MQKVWLCVTVLFLHFLLAQEIIIDDSYIEKLDSKGSLSLANTKLKGKLIVKNSFDMKHLDVSNNELTEIIIESDWGIKSLIACNNNITKVTLPNNSYLKEIDLSNNLMTEFPVFDRVEKYKKERSWKRWPLQLAKGYALYFEKNGNNIIAAEIAACVCFGLGAYGNSTASYYERLLHGYEDNALTTYIKSLESLIDPQIFSAKNLINPLEDNFEKLSIFWNGLATTSLFIGFISLFYMGYKLINFKSGYDEHINDLKKERDDICSDLKYLNVSNNRITAIPRHINKLWDIRYLDIRNNRIKKFPFTITKLQEKFSCFNVSGNPLGVKTDGAKGTLFDACIQSGTWSRSWRVWFPIKKQKKKIKKALTLYTRLKDMQQKGSFVLFPHINLVQNEQGAWQGYINADCPQDRRVIVENWGPDIIKKINEYSIATSTIKK